MSDELDLDAIEARAKAWADTTHEDGPHAGFRSAADVPALLAEVKRLRATTPEVEYRAVGKGLNRYRLTRQEAENWRSRGYEISARTPEVPAGPWLPVPDPTPDNEGGLNDE